MGMHYTAWVNALGRNPSSPEAALGTIAPELAYLVRMNSKLQFVILHHIQRWRSPNGGRSCLHNRIVAFEGEVLPQYNLPLLYRFKKDDAELLQLQVMPTGAPSHATRFYRDGQRDDKFHWRVPPTPRIIREAQP